MSNIGNAMTASNPRVGLASRTQNGEASTRGDASTHSIAQAVYSTEIELPEMVHAVLATSTIANGRIDAGAARLMPGVLEIFTSHDAGDLQAQAAQAPAGFAPSREHGSNDHTIAVVVATTLKQAQDAAQMITVRNVPDAPAFDFSAQRVSVEQLRSKDQAAIAAWDDDRVTLFGSVQYSESARAAMAKLLGIGPEQFRVVCRYTGADSGTRDAIGSHVALAAIAARKVGRPVRLEPRSTQMLACVGSRPLAGQQTQAVAENSRWVLAKRRDVPTRTSARSR